MMKSRLLKSRLVARNGARLRRATPATALALASALAAFAVASFGARAARAEDLFGTVLKSLGINNNDPIEYKERPPLVVPQTHDLPPPQSTRTRDPNWPADPKAGARATRSDQLDNIDRLAVPQRPASAGGPDTTANVPTNKPGLFGKLFNSNEDAKGAVPKTTPARKALTQPPADYEETARPGAPDNPQPGASGL
jgi:hypothetical protein